MTNLIPPEPPADPTIVQQPEFKKGRHYDAVTDMQPILDGKVILPNFEPIPIELAVSNASHWYGHVHDGASARFGTRYPSRALYFLTVGQGGGLTGEGMVMTTGGWKDGKQEVITGRFAICKHKKVEGAGANHDRGWHPGWCEKCGLDMSVDSGD